MVARLRRWAKPTRSCVLCRLPARLSLCPDCLADLPRLHSPCPNCGLPSPGGPCKRCRLAPPPFSALVAGALYQPPWDRLIHGFKYRRQWWLDRALCLPLLAALGDRPLPDVLVPVPMHKWRLLWRGFNQAELLANHLGERLGIAVDNGLLVRRRHTRKQQGLNRKGRQRNLKGAFTVTKTPPKRVALIDDVVTTGTTVSLLSRQLLAAGCEDVQVWCLARAL
ncbi:ComF family protein [Gallaecimonas sp. GXIMD4217]|uniref:ComF family protein n=1 Tax=Gallaecimonas sp. GXIMD4217 TaxID=3131927 RepID=UPI00311B355C